MSQMKRADGNGEAKATGFDHLEGQPPTWPVPLGPTAFSTPLCVQPAPPTLQAAAIISFQCGRVGGGGVVTFLLTTTLWLPLSGLKAFSGFQPPLFPAPLPGLNFLRFFPAVTATPRLWFPPAPSLLGQCPSPLPCPSGQCLCLQRTL